MKSDQRENQALQVLNQVVEWAKSNRIFAVIHFHKTANFAGRERDMVVAAQNLQFLATHAIRFRPIGVVFLLFYIIIIFISFLHS